MICRKNDDKDVDFSSIPGHCGGFGVIVNKIGRGLPRFVSCGKEFTVVSTYPYEGPSLEVAIKLMEESQIREEETQLRMLQDSKFDNDNIA